MIDLTGLPGNLDLVVIAMIAAGVSALVVGPTALVLRARRERRRIDRERAARIHRMEPRARNRLRAPGNAGRFSLDQERNRHDG